MVRAHYSPAGALSTTTARLKEVSPILDFTVVICTYNGANRIPEVLAQLQRQVDVEGLRWEVLVVDNNSTDNLTDVFQRFQSDWGEDSTLHYLFESKQGPAYARQQAIRAAKSELIGFLDDDNIPADNWVAAAYRFGQAHPQAGAYGSRVQGQFEVNPPEEFDRIRAFFALTQRGDFPLRYERQRKVLPPGAGLVVRRKAWLESVPKQCILSGPIANIRIGGEDLEAVSHIQNSPWEVWYNPEMEISHKIAAERITRDYLLRFFRGIGLSRHVTRMLGCDPWQRPFWFLLYIANDLRRILAHFFKYRTQLRSDLVAACEFQLYVSSLISPLYIWRMRLLNRS
ncbi:MAG: hormogonium polysaccharide biosynthesis glycosyltransferase HpsE [Cyanobacteria bacterium P01_A01_bin.123]